MDQVYKTPELHEAVRNTFSEGYVYLTEVRDATGFDAVRTADGIAIGMYRSRGRAIHGFELKCSRADWSKELRQPAKSESLMRYCNTWSLIAASESIVHDGELPKPWGFGVPHRKRSNANLKIQWIVKPPELKPQSYDIVFLTALIMAARQEPIKDMQSVIAQARAEGIAQGERGEERQRKSKEQAEKIIDDFSRATGIYISRFSTDADIQELAQEFREFRNKERTLENSASELQSLLEQSERIAHGIRRVIHPDLYESIDHRHRFRSK